MPEQGADPGRPSLGRYKGLRVMITGAAGGFGAAAAKRFAAEGADLLVCDLDSAGLAILREALGDGVSVASESFDLNDETALSDFVGSVSHIDVAINNAGIGQVLTPLHKTDMAEFDRIMAVNTRAVFQCMKEQLPGMIARKSGAIVNVASAAGLVGAGHMAAYAASKHAVVGLTRAAADEVARHGVRVNALCPSFAPTPLFDAVADDLAARRGTDRAGAYARITARVPMRRAAHVSDVVEAMLFLADPANSFVTGQALAVDGGLTAV